MAADLGDLLGHGGWELVDPRPAAAEHPETFELPTRDELAALRPGSQVRAMFRLATIADLARDGRPPYDDLGRPVLVDQVERMWVVVTGIVDGAVDGVLENQPYATHTRLTVNDRVRLPLSHVIATGPPIEDYGGFLDFVGRWEADPDFQPRPHRRDTGWVFFADSADLEEVAESVGFDIVPLQEVRRAYPAAWPYTALPPGWGFTSSGRGEDVYRLELAD